MLLRTDLSQSCDQGLALRREQPWAHISLLLCSESNVGGWVRTGEATATPPQINSEELEDREQMDSLYKANVLGPYAQVSGSLRGLATLGYLYYYAAFSQNTQWELLNSGFFGGSVLST